MQRSHKMGHDKIGKLLMKFSIPAIAGMLIFALYNIVDRIFVGQAIGSLAIVGITITFPFMIIIMAFNMLVGLGATALISLKLGESRQKEAEQIFANALGVIIVISLLISAMGFCFLEPILITFGASAAVLPCAKEYMRIILLGIVFIGISFGMQNTIRAEGKPHIAMFTQMIGALSNIMLDYIFIFPLDMGIKGAALGTIIANGISAAFVLSYYLSKKSLIKIHIQNMLPDFNVIASILAVGFPPFAMQLANSLQQVILNRSLAYYGGDIAVAAIGVIFSILHFIVTPIIGISQGAQPLIGYNYGARQYERVKHTFKLALTSATTIVLIGFLLTRLIPEQLISLFSRSDASLIDMGIHGMSIFFICLPVVGFHIISSNYFQAVGKSIQATILNLSRQFLLFIPVLLILPRYLGLEGIWWSAPVADLSSALLAGIWITIEMKGLGKESKLKAYPEADQKAII